MAKDSVFMIICKTDICCIDISPEKKHLYKKQLTDVTCHLILWHSPCTWKCVDERKQELVFLFLLIKCWVWLKCHVYSFSNNRTCKQQQKTQSHRTDMRGITKIIISSAQLRRHFSECPRRQVSRHLFPLRRSGYSKLNLQSILSQHLLIHICVKVS